MTASNRSGSSRFEDVLAEPDGCHRVGGQSLSLLDDVREADETVGLVEHRDIDHLGVEDVTESVSDEVVHRLHLEVLGQTPLDVVDQRELGVALAGLLEQPSVLEGDAEAARERCEQADVRLAERVLAVEVLERNAADRLTADDERDQQHRGGHLFRSPHPRAAQLGDPFLDALVEQERLPRVQHVSAEGTRRRGVDEVADASFDRVRPRDHPRVAIEHADVQHLCIEDFDQPVAEQIVHGLHVEVFGEAALDVVDHGQLGVALAGLLEQARVLERDAQAPGEGGQESHVRVAERVLSIVVLERDQSGGLVANEERDEDRGERVFPRDQWITGRGAPSRHILVDDDRLPRLEGGLAEPVDLDRLVVEADPSFDLVGEVDAFGGHVEDLDIDDLRVEDLLDPIADQVIHRLHLEPFGEPPLHVVDERELGVPLSGLLEQTRVLERDAQAPGERHQEPQVGVVEGVLAVDVLERDHAGRLAPDHQRHEHAGPRRLALDRLGLVVLGEQFLRNDVEQEGLARSEDVLPEAHDGHRLVGEADAFLDRVGEVDEPGRLVQDADVHDLRVEDLLQPVADQVVHRLHVEVHRQSALDVVDQRELGVALTGLVDQAGALEGGGDVPPDEGQKLLVRLGMRRLLPVALNDDGPEGLVLRLQRDAEPGHRLLADHDDLAACGQPAPLIVREQHRPTRFGSGIR